MIRVCKHCSTQYDTANKPKGWMANHSRWCVKNPKRNTYNQDLSKARAAKTPEGRVAAAEKLKILHRDGRYDHLDRKNFLGKKHTDASKKKISEGALKSKHRRLRKGVVFYKGVMLDSSWELALAKRLDVLGIIWLRPEPFKWVDKMGVYHNYFADFYLPDYDIYLDPKNPYALKVQKEKLDLLLEQYNNIKIIHSLIECENFNIKDII